MSSELKVAVVGCGQIADGHAGEIQKLSNAKLVAVCDLEPLMAEQLAVRFGVPAHYSDLERLLSREKPDVLHICTPPASHLPLAKAALSAGCHLYVEKPLALTHAQTEELLAAARSAGRELTIGHTYRYDPPAEELRRRIAAGDLGEVLHVESWYGYNLDGPFGKVLMSSPDHWVHRLPGKLFHNNIDHLLSKVVELLPDEEPLIQAFGWRQNADRVFGDARDELLDELRVLIRGRHVSAYATFTSNVKPVAHWQRVCGSKATMHADFQSRTLAFEQGPTLPSAIGRLAAGFAQSWQYARSAAHNVGRFAANDYHYFAGLRALIGKFYDSISNGGPAPISHSEIAKTSRMMDEIFRQTAEAR